MPGPWPDFEKRVNTARVGSAVHWRGTGWCALPGSVLVFVLALLLVSTTPIGTGAGVHQFDLVHPLFSHVHLVNGRLLSHEQLEQGQSGLAPAAGPVARGPAIGAGSGLEPVDSGVGWSPTPLFQVTSLLAGAPWAWTTAETRLPAGRVEAPPDPPPTSAV
jgi:hypothetical protein